MQNVKVLNITSKECNETNNKQDGICLDWTIVNGLQVIH